MSVVEPLPGAEIASEFARVAARRVLVLSPTIRYRLGPGDRALVAPGDAVVPGMPIAERTPDAELVDAGKLIRPDDGKSPKTDRPADGRQARLGQAGPAPPAVSR